MMRRKIEESVLKKLTKAQGTKNSNSKAITITNSPINLTNVPATASDHGIRPTDD
jgi:hypothetical protein